ncbi:MAG: hypothetical protein FJ143_12435 [Deltaproteobacteria bacterium]|nr:hypothetical protein [Deltaproteobacteria bacterium]
MGKKYHKFHSRISTRFRENSPPAAQLPVDADRHLTVHAERHGRQPGVDLLKMHLHLAALQLGGSTEAVIVVAQVDLIETVVDALVELRAEAPPLDFAVGSGC